MQCPDCGSICELQHLTSGLDYDWCAVCQQDVSYGNTLTEALWYDPYHEESEDRAFFENEPYFSQLQEQRDDVF